MGGTHLKKPAKMIDKESRIATPLFFCYMKYYLDKEDITRKLAYAAQKYDCFADQVLLFVYQKNKKGKCEVLMVKFGKENFMHLVGIKSKMLSATQFYEACINENIKYVDCSPSHSPANRNKRIQLLPKMMCFSDCRIYDIAEKDVTTIHNDFQIACGNNSGIIGFDYRGIEKENKVAVPTTLLDRPLADYCFEPRRILFVFVEKSDRYEEVYAIKKGLYKEFVAQGKIDDYLRCL